MHIPIRYKNEVKDTKRVRVLLELRNEIMTFPGEALRRNETSVSRMFRQFLDTSGFFHDQLSRQ